MSNNNSSGSAQETSSVAVFPDPTEYTILGSRSRKSTFSCIEKQSMKAKALAVALTHFFDAPQLEGAACMLKEIELRVTYGDFGMECLSIAGLAYYVDENDVIHKLPLQPIVTTKSCRTMKFDWNLAHLVVFVFSRAPRFANKTKLFDETSWKSDVRLYRSVNNPLSPCTLLSSNTHTIETILTFFATKMMFDESQAPDLDRISTFVVAIKFVKGPAGEGYFRYTGEGKRVREVYEDAVLPLLQFGTNAIACELNTDDDNPYELVEPFYYAFQANTRNDRDRYEVIRRSIKELSLTQFNKYSEDRSLLTSTYIAQSPPDVIRPEPPLPPIPGTPDDDTFLTKNTKVFQQLINSVAHDIGKYEDRHSGGRGQFHGCGMYYVLQIYFTYIYAGDFAYEVEFVRYSKEGPQTSFRNIHRQINNGGFEGGYDPRCYTRYFRFAPMENIGGWTVDPGSLEVLSRRLYNQFTGIDTRLQHVLSLAQKKIDARKQRQAEDQVSAGTVWIPLTPGKFVRFVRESSEK